MRSRTLTPRNLARYEPLGLRARAKPLKGGFVHVGEIVGETKNMFRMLRDDGRIVSLPKNSYRFVFELPSGEKVLVDGRVLVGRPEERLKRRLKRW